MEQHLTIMNKSLLAPLAFLYGTGVSIRHKLFDWKILRSREYEVPVVCIGNITVGGTGKTPMTDFLVSNFKGKYRIAVLSRGYKRKTKGYVEAIPDSSFLSVGDEPKQLKMNHPDVVVAVCENRNKGIEKILAAHPDIQLIILDDGFQHRYVEPWVNIVLMDHNRPVFKDHLLPRGNLRDVRSQLHRAKYLIVTKCPPGMNPLERRIMRNSMGLYPYQYLYFTSTELCPLKPVFEEGYLLEPGKVRKIIAMSGIANPSSFRESLKGKYQVMDEIIFPDHHPYRRRDLDRIEAVLSAASKDTVIVTTEKDAVKLMKSKKIPDRIRERLYFIPIKISFNENFGRDFLSKLDHDIRTNPKHGLLH